MKVGDRVEFDDIPENTNNPGWYRGVIVGVYLKTSRAHDCPCCKCEEVKEPAYGWFIIKLDTSIPSGVRPPPAEECLYPECRLKLVR